MNPDQLWQQFNPTFRAGQTGMDVEASLNNMSFNMKRENEHSQCDNAFVSQYSKIYISRLNLLKKHFLNKMKAKNLLITSVNEAEAGEECYVVGNLYKKLINKASFLKILESSEYQELYPDANELTGSDEDQLYVEDMAGRRLLVFNQSKIDYEGFSGNLRNISLHGLVSGLTVAIQGKAGENNEFFVNTIHLPGAPNPKHSLLSILTPTQCYKETIQNIMKRGTDGNLIAFISGLEITGDSDCGKLQHLMEFLSGVSINDNMTASILDQTKQLYILGNSLCLEKNINFNLLGSYMHKEKFAELQKRMKIAIDLLGGIIECISENIGVTILPGKTDPSDAYLPQEPLHPSFFSEYTRSPVLASNPCTSELLGKTLLLSSGQNVEDLLCFAHVNYL